MTRSGGTKLLLHGREFYYTAEQKEDRKTSVSLVQIEGFDELPFRITVDYHLNCVNGLFCIWEPLFFAAIFSPSTREVRFLPDINDGSSLWYCSFGFDPEEKKYKVLFTTKHIIKGYIKHWTQSITPPILCKPGVCINGVIYKFVFQERLTIDAFDVKTENSKNIGLLNASHCLWYYELLEVKGKLAIMD
ncbi:hypothetical protein R3W88_025143 [Solanum pinnatisectum]|uniref:F-box associated beta-propeller type 3 domain-containing protein n=1 Tax=Solanum pinnatisectum TaxID=50273 RepID=A0AAV9M5J1_9SOLN|nr:hypothetical protein R3W88_025143 [Solanum pinnatisectum]